MPFSSNKNILSKRTWSQVQVQILQVQCVHIAYKYHVQHISI